jgi:hypothetical protein
MRVAALALSFLLSACGATHIGEPPAVDSETHFLTLCASACDEGLTCVCGVCTRECEKASECGELAQDASCSAPRAGDKRACGRILPVAVCEAECRDDGDCATVGPDHRCDQGVCRAGPAASGACPARSAPDCDEGEHLRAETDDDGCAKPVCAPDDICTLPLETPPMCLAGRSTYTFVAERGRCELGEHDGCTTSENKFATEQDCWASCEQDNAGLACLEVWEPVYGSADTGLHVNAAHAIARLEGTHRADMELSPGGDVTPLVLTITNAVAYRVRTADNPNYALADVPPPCEDSVQLEATATFETEDGSFREHWPRLRFTVTPSGVATAAIHVKRPGVPSNDSENATFRGSYVPPLEPGTCDLYMAISILLARDTFSGEISFLIANAACEDVVGTTGVGQGSPIGPTWLSTDQFSTTCVDSVCCELLSVRECSVDEQCQLIEGRLLNESDPDNLCFDSGPAGCMARDMSCREEGTQARDPQGACWFFNTGCQPIDFVELGEEGDPTCNGTTRSSVPACL